MRGGEAPAPKGSARPPVACSECREDLQLQVGYCPFCGALQQVAAPLVDLLNGVDWQAELQGPPPPSPPVPDMRADETPQPIPVPVIAPDPIVDPPRETTPFSDDGAGALQPGRSKRRLVALALIVVIGAALFARYAPPASTGSKGRDVAAVQPSPAVPVPVPTPVPVPAARNPAPAVKPAPAPKRSSVRLTKTWRTVALGSNGERTSISIEGNGPFRVRAGRKLYVVDGTDPVELDLRGLTEVDLRAVAGSMTVDIVAARNRSLVGN